MRIGETEESEYREEGVVLLPDDGQKHIYDDPRNIDRVVKSFLAVCLFLFLFDIVFIFHHKHLSFTEGEFPLEGFFGFFGIYGFGACVLLVLLAKYVLRNLVMRDDDYYER